MLHSLLDFLRTLTTPERLIELLRTILSGWLGYAALFGIVFSETGLLLGFFLPGDSLMFTVGVVAGTGALNAITSPTSNPPTGANSNGTYDVNNAQLLLSCSPKIGGTMSAFSA